MRWLIRDIGVGSNIHVTCMRRQRRKLLIRQQEGQRDLNIIFLRVAPFPAPQNFNCAVKNAYRLARSDTDQEGQNIEDKQNKATQVNIQKQKD